MESRSVKKKNGVMAKLILLVIIYAIFQISQILLERTPYAVYNGVIQALQYGVCLLLMFCDRKKGLRIATVLIFISGISLMRAMIRSQSISVLPGMFNCLFYFITIIMLYQYNRRREIESITDVMTGLLNRRGLYNNLQSRIDAEKPFGVIYLILDNFKFINDNHGHAYGDELMRKVSARMVDLVGSNGSIARLAGTEFVICVDDKLDLQKTADNLLDIIQEKTTVEVDGVPVDCYMTCYAGISSYPQDATDYESLIKNADMAMFEAKSGKEKKAVPFSSRMQEELNQQVSMENLLKDGLKNDYFFLVYQPQYHLDGKKLRGFETLIRMKDHSGAFVSPGAFIPVAERSDMILHIDDYVLHRAMNEFREIVLKRPSLIISVNVSAKNIASRDFVEKIEHILSKTKYPAKNLEIEITEYCMVDSMEQTIENITKLRDMGIQVALDDFGTGYTSLSYVAKLPINLLKVDKSLVDGIGMDPKSRAFVHTVINMGHLMGCEVISEGVEDEIQLNYLQEDGCDFVQGFVWGKPLDYSVAKELANQS